MSKDKTIGIMTAAEWVKFFKQGGNWQRNTHALCYVGECLEGIPPETPLEISEHSLLMTPSTEHWNPSPFQHTEWKIKGFKGGVLTSGMRAITIRREEDAVVIHLTH